MAGQQTAYAGSSVEVLINVINSAGNHVSAVINTGSTRLDAYPSVIPSVSTVGLGIYKITFSGLSPATAEGDSLVAKINGTIDGIAWTTFGVLVKVVAAERGTDNSASSSDIAALNNLSAADVRTAVGLANADLDTQLGTLATASDLTTVDTVVDAIKLVTDQFVFTNPGEVDANAVTGGGGLTQADVRTAVGLASANLDTQLSNINTQVGVVDGVVDSILIDTGTDIPALINSLQDLSQADVRTAVGLATANLDTQIGTLATASDLTTVDTVVDAIKAVTDQFVFTNPGEVDANAVTGGISQADVRTAVGLASANLDTQLGTLATTSDLTTVDTVVDSIKSVTDQFVFTNPGEVDANAVTGGISQADVRTAVGLASANLDTQIGTLSTSADLSTVDTVVDSIKSVTDQFVFTNPGEVDANAVTGGISQADVRNAVGLANADLDTQLGTLATTSDLTTVDTVVDSIKSVTDQFVFTNPGEVDANAVTGGISQADVRNAVGLASANLDSQISTLATGTDVSSLNNLSSSDVESAVWDSSVSSHNLPGSFAKGFRQIKEGLVTDESSVNDSSATASSFVTLLSSVVDDFYVGKNIVFISGDLNGQSRVISSYDGSTKQITVGEELTSAPSDSDEFIILSTHVHTRQEIAETVYSQFTSGDNAETFRADVSGINPVGTGAVEHTVTVKVGGVPLSGVDVWFTTDAAGTNVVAGTVVTDVTGKAKVMLDPGSYYQWVQLAGYNFPNPTSITVS